MGPLDMAAQREGGLDRLAPVSRETVQDRIYHQLRDQLIRGGFEAGEVFLPGDLAERMAVSSTPVREALARLVSERALEAMANRRVRVPPLSLGRARDIAQARMLVEGDLARRAVMQVTPALLVRLETLTSEYELAGNPQEFAHLNHAFHFTIYAAADSSVLLPFVESLWMQGGPYIRAAARLHSPLRDAAATIHHRGVLSGLAAGDETRTAQELCDDIGLAFNILERADSDFWAAAENI
ncbi:MAG: GntR family transcriptional regulator [Pseudorhodobacter sp.]